MVHSVAHSMISNRKTSTISEQKSKTEKHGSNVGGKTAVGAPSGEAGSQVSKVGITHHFHFHFHFHLDDTHCALTVDSLLNDVIFYSLGQIYRMIRKYRNENSSYFLIDEQMKEILS